MSEFIEFNTYQEELKQCVKCNRRLARFKGVNGKYYCPQCVGKDPTLFGKCYYSNNREDLYTIARHECRDNTIEDGELLEANITFYNILIKYLYDDSIDMTDLDEIEKIKYQDNSILFYAIPCIIFCLQNSIKSLIQIKDDAENNILDKED